jgi:MFS family permease
MRPQASIFTPILISASVILFLSFTIRSSFGVFQIPIAADLGWMRSEFSLAIAIQNLAWGLATPVFGAIAERFGDKRAILAGTLLYSAGLCLSA